MISTTGIALALMFSSVAGDARSAAALVAEVARARDVVAKRPEAIVGADERPDAEPAARERRFPEVRVATAAPPTVPENELFHMSWNSGTVTG